LLFCALEILLLTYLLTRSVFLTHKELTVVERSTGDGHVLAVTTVVTAPRVVLARRNRRLVADTLHLVKPYSTPARPVLVSQRHADVSATDSRYQVFITEQSQHSALVYKSPCSQMVLGGIGLSHGRPNFSISGDLLSENETKPVVI